MSCTKHFVRYLVYSKTSVFSITKKLNIFGNEQLMKFVREKTMDRRQKKTREAIFQAFTRLLSEKDYNAISVQDIIDEADVGRTTFYTHFETKDYLLKDMCEELFGHIVDTAMGHEGHYHCTFANPEDSVFLHLLRHLQENDRNILELLSSCNNGIFLKYFKQNLKKLITTLYSEKGLLNTSVLPEDYVINHITSSFVETVDWWLAGSMKEGPEKITEYFAKAVETCLN